MIQRYKNISFHWQYNYTAKEEQAINDLGRWSMHATDYKAYVVSQYETKLVIIW